MRRRTRYSLLTVLAIFVALAVAVLLRKEAPPEAARLLPESDAIVYFNLKPLRGLTHFDRSPIQRAQDYQKFVDATGFIFERDLDEAAFAIHRMPDPNGPNGPVAFSEVFVGRFNDKRLAQYFASIAASTETYVGHEIYTIPVDGRTLRVTMLGYDMVAASNMPTAEQIHSILDRYRSAALPFSGSSLLAAQYRNVPLLSLAWGIGRIGLPFGHDGKLQVLGLTLPIPTDTTFVASLRYVGSLRLRVEAITPNEAMATASTDTLKTFLSLYQALQAQQAQESQGQNQTPTNAEFQQVINSIKVSQHDNHAVVTATLPISLVKRTFSASPEASNGGDTTSR
ncbi:MAG: hypothetical protein ACYC46_01365 [Acidobacteriaceae bacterium]